mgnify:FL=1
MFEKKVLETINKYKMIENGDSVIVAVSGGPDSISLLYTLIRLREKLNIKLTVAHVNHMLRDVADSETRYVEHFCECNYVDCFVKRVDVKKLAEEQKIGTEEAGRNVRYDFFEEVFEKIHANKIAIAHNKSDNAETVLMNIMRGTGLSGIKGIEPVRNNKIIRPLIEMDRDSIDKYCSDKSLFPKFDETNLDNSYTRNKVRNLLIPYIKNEFNPNFIDGINRLAELATQEDSYIESVVEKEFNDILISENSQELNLDLQKFNELHDFIKSKVIFKCINELFGTTKGIEKVHIEDVIKLCRNNIGNKYLMPNKNVKVFINRGVITVSKEL